MYVTFFPHGPLQIQMNFFKTETDLIYTNTQILTH